jgi:hypothetical protein
VAAGLYLVVSAVSSSSLASLDEPASLVAAVLWAPVCAGLALGFQCFSGLAASRLGWVPAFGAAMAMLVLVLRLGLPAGEALLSIGLVAATGPLFAELGYQLKAGGELGRATLRRQQTTVALLGLAVAVAVVSFRAPAYFERGVIPPVSQVLAVALELGQRAGGLSSLGPWIATGAVAQWLAGASRQVGLLFATGLLLPNPAAGWALLVGLAARFVVSAGFRGRADLGLALFGLGCIGGELLRASSSAFIEMSFR